MSKTQHSQSTNETNAPTPTANIVAETARPMHFQQQRKPHQQAVNDKQKAMRVNQHTFKIVPMLQSTWPRNNIL